MIYATVHMTVDSPENLALYRAKAANALAKHGGSVFAMHKDPTILEGDVAKTDIAGILAFPNRDAALSWINDEDLAGIHALRRDSGDSNILLIG